MTANFFLLVRKLEPWAVLPTKAYEGDAGWDLYGRVAKMSPTSSGVLQVEFDTGLAFGIPSGYYGHIRARSAFMREFGMFTLGGVIDSGYRGEVKLLMGVLHADRFQDFLDEFDLDVIKIAQMLVLPVPHMEVVSVASLPESERGERGFGSSGRT